MAGQTTATRPVWAEANTRLRRIASSLGDCAWRGAPQRAPDLATRHAPKFALEHLRPITRAAVALLLATFAHSASAADPFRTFLDAIWPQAQKAGVTRATFDTITRDLKPDLSLPDLVIPGRKTPAPGQAEFVRPPQDYLNAKTLSRLAQTGRTLSERHKAVLTRIEREIGVDRNPLLAIWGRETAFGAYKLPHDGIQVLATQAYTGRRKELFLNEFVLALKLLQDGVPRQAMRASWAGAMGLTQFLPSEIIQHGVDMDGDGKVDLAGSVPDALASAARQLKAKGWVTGLPWGFEVTSPLPAQCALEGPWQARSLAAWAKLGFKRRDGKAFAPQHLDVEAYLMQPAGAFGPAFLVTENYKTFRRYNMSDLYATFVGNLGDRIGGGDDFLTRWSDPRQLATRDIEAVQQHLQQAGHARIDKIDGKIGSATRAEIGAWQTANKVKVDCWPTTDLLGAMRRARPSGR